MSFLVKMCECFEVKPLETVVIGTIPYIQPATRKEYFVIAERDNNKILWALDIDTESDNVKQIDKNDVFMFHAMPMTKKLWVVLRRSEKNIGYIEIKSVKAAVRTLKTKCKIQNFMKINWQKFSKFEFSDRQE